MIRTKFPAIAKWLASVFNKPSVVAIFYMEDAIEVLRRAVVHKFKMPSAQSEDQAFKHTKNKLPNPQV